MHIPYKNSLAIFNYLQKHFKLKASKFHYSISVSEVKVLRPAQFSLQDTLPRLSACGLNTKRAKSTNFNYLPE